MREYRTDQYEIYVENIAHFLNDLCEYHKISYRALARGDDVIRKQISLYIQKKKRTILLNDLTNLADLLKYDVLDILDYSQERDFNDMIINYKHHDGEDEKA
ncbi:helix-turn-helix domain-containing protein [Erysipelothrix sp. HDW6A]|uniref:helix-turn-helix domain-containing protein n=1 Tax=Erysipelothrix sp. HDW6A TaxID=2714928 RepID=UPI00140DAAB1|nr:helix-turn-helix domain-containing protein [Erysipelothrix sp. HDW6A]QIK56995.1 helix-turn-helix domain-containing protein [Erysipelothrix sp. HDW6A]